jgi:hypothetical protein
VLGTAVFAGATGVWAVGVPTWPVAAGAGVGPAPGVAVGPAAGVALGPTAGAAVGPRAGVGPEAITGAGLTFGVELAVRSAVPAGTDGGVAPVAPGPGAVVGLDGAVVAEVAGVGAEGGGAEGARAGAEPVGVGVGAVGAPGPIVGPGGARLVRVGAGPVGAVVEAKAGGVPPASTDPKTEAPSTTRTALPTPMSGVLGTARVNRFGLRAPITETTARSKSQ